MHAREPIVAAYCETRGCGKQVHRDGHGLLNITVALSRDQQTEAATFSLADPNLVLSRPLLLLQANTTQRAVTARRLLYQRPHTVAN